MPERLIGVDDLTSGAGVVDYRVRERSTWGTTFTDDFNRADAGNLGASWTEWNSSHVIASNQAKAENEFNCGSFTAQLDSDDHFAEFTMTAAPEAGSIIGVMLRGPATIGTADSTTGALYCVTISGSTTFGTTLAIRYKLANSAPLTNLVTTSTGINFVVGSRLRAEIIGTTIIAYIDGVEKLRTTDTAPAIVTTGQRRVGIFSNMLAASTVFPSYDNFVAGVAVPAVEQYVIPVEERVVSAAFWATTNRTAGVATADTHLASLWNPAGSNVILAVRRLEMNMDFVSNSGTIRIAGVGRVTSAPAGGTLLTPVPLDTSRTGAAGVEWRGTAASDGGSVTAITATPVNRLGSILTFRAQSLVNKRRPYSAPLIPSPALSDPVYLRPGEGLLVTTYDAASVSLQYAVNVFWEEFTLP